MDNKKSPIRRAKRGPKVIEDNFWDCSVCTFRNTAEAFKCLMCDVRKGTSTRKPRINPQLVAQQVASQFLPATSSSGTTKKERKDKKALKKRRHLPRLKNVDRSTAQTREVTVNSITVVITEYKPKIKSAETVSSSSSSDHGSQSESSMDAR
ncbi:YY1-associated factor 2 [Dendroctonus ponderosae]